MTVYVLLNLAFEILRCPRRVWTLFPGVFATRYKNKKPVMPQFLCFWGGGRPPQSPGFPGTFRWVSFNQTTRHVAGEAHPASEVVDEFCAISRRRWDEPLGPRNNSARGSLDLAVRIGRGPVLIARAAAEFESRTLACTTRPTYDSQLRAIVRIAEAAQFALLPMTRAKVAIVGGALKAAHIKTANLYLVRYKRAHVEAGHPVDDDLLLVLRSAKRAALRGNGATKKAAVFKLDQVAALPDEETPATPGGPRHPRRFVLIGTDPDGHGLVGTHSCPDAG